MRMVNGRHESANGLPSRVLFRSSKDGGSRPWKRWTALIGLVGAPVSGALGACALAVAYVLQMADGAWLTTAGNALLVAVIPLLLLGAAALDWIEADLAARPCDRRRRLRALPACRPSRNLGARRVPLGPRRPLLGRNAGAQGDDGDLRV